MTGERSFKPINHRGTENTENIQKCFSDIL
jgi:hypothetical protein